MNDQYKKPEIEVITFYTEDIIRTSGETPQDEIGKNDMGIDWWTNP